MDIKARLIGAGAVVLLIGGGVVAAGLANANDSTPDPVATATVEMVTPSASSTPAPAVTPSATPSVVSEPVVTQEPTVTEPVAPAVDPSPVSAPQAPEPADGSAADQPQTVIQPENPGDPLLIPGDDPSRVVINP